MSRQNLGMFAALASSAAGGLAGGATRFVIHATDPVTLGVFRFGVGFLILLPVAIAMKVRWPQARDRLAAAALGVMFFFAFSVLFNLAYAYTTAARGALTLSTMPLTTMLIGASLRVERLNPFKVTGVVLALAGVCIALMFGASGAGRESWKGEAIMFAATICMSLYNVWSRPFILRSSPLGFLTVGMGAAALCLVIWAALIHGFVAVNGFGLGQWIAISYLGIIGSAGVFMLWVVALSLTTPTKTAVTISVNPIFASIVGALAVGESIGFNLILGLGAVAVGIWLTTVTAGEENTTRALVHRN